MQSFGFGQSNAFTHVFECWPSCQLFYMLGFNCKLKCFGACELVFDTKL